jgi:glutaredoxin 3
MKPVRVYSTLVCPYCINAKQLLESHGVSYEDIRIDKDTQKREEMERLSGQRTVPQIFIGDRHVGGYTDLKKLSDSGELIRWLND